MWKLREKICLNKTKEEEGGGRLKKLFFLFTGDSRGEIKKGGYV
jgi:hypothetical protein